MVLIFAIAISFANIAAAMRYATKDKRNTDLVLAFQLFLGLSVLTKIQKRDRAC